MKFIDKKRQEYAGSQELSSIVSVVKGVTLGILLIALSSVCQVLKVFNKGGRL